MGFWNRTPKVGLPEALQLLVHELRAMREERRTDNTATIIKLLTTMATQIQQFADKQNAFNARLGTAIDGVVADIKTLNDLITQLQNNPGPISPEDQATLDNLQATGEALAARLESVDQMTPPVVPTTPPTA